MATTSRPADRIPSVTSDSDIEAYIEQERAHAGDEALYMAQVYEIADRLRAELRRQGQRRAAQG